MVDSASFLSFFCWEDSSLISMDVDVLCWLCFKPSTCLAVSLQAIAILFHETVSFSF